MTNCCEIYLKKKAKATPRKVDNIKELEKRHTKLNTLNYFEENINTYYYVDESERKSDFSPMIAMKIHLAITFSFEKFSVYYSM